MYVFIVCGICIERRLYLHKRDELTCYHISSDSKITKSICGNPPFIHRPRSFQKYQPKDVFFQGNACSKLVLGCYKKNAYNY